MYDYLIEKVVYRSKLEWSCVCFNGIIHYIILQLENDDWVKEWIKEKYAKSESGKNDNNNHNAWKKVCFAWMYVFD